MVISKVAPVNLKLLLLKSRTIRNSQIPLIHEKNQEKDRQVGTKLNKKLTLPKIKLHKRKRDKNEQ